MATVAAPAPGGDGGPDAKKVDTDLLALERDAKFNAWLQRKAILDSSYEYLKLLDSNRGKYRDQTVDIAVSLLAVDKLLEQASKNVETTMTTVKAGLEAKKGETENVDGNVSVAGTVRASVTKMPPAPWRPGGLRQAPGRLPPPLTTTSLAANAKKGEVRVSVKATEGCMKGMWAVIGEGADADLCKIAHAAGGVTASTTSLAGAAAGGGAGTVELYSPGLAANHAAGAEIKVYASDSWKMLSEALSAGALDGRDTDGPGTKSMKSVWMKWAMEHHTLSDVVLTKDDLSRLSEGAREGVYEDKDEATGEKKPVFLSLKYSFPKGYKPIFLTKREEEKQKKQEKKQKKDKKDDGPAKKKTKEEIEAEEKLKKRGGLTEDAVVKNELFMRELKKMWAEASQAFRTLVEKGVAEVAEKRKARAEAAKADAKAAEKGKGGDDDKAGDKEDKKGKDGGGDAKGGPGAAAGKDGDKGKDKDDAADAKGDAKTGKSGGGGGGGGDDDAKGDAKGGAGTAAGAAEGGADGTAAKSNYVFSGSKVESFVLHELALRRLKEWAEEDEDKWMVEEAATKREEEDEWKKQFRSYAAKKDKIRIRLPDPEDVAKLPLPKPPPMEFRLKAVPRPKSAPVGLPR